jgi:hypothetical protein
MTKNWKPCQISPDAHRCLRLASAVTGKDMRLLASEAIVEFCAKVLNDRGMSRRARKK